MDQKQVSRRNFFKGTVTLAGAAGAALSLEEQQLLAMQPPPGGAPQGGRGQFGGRSAVTAVPEVPGPVPTIKLGGLEISRLIAGHNLVVGQAHEGGSGLVYISSLLRNYFTEEKVMETFAAYEANGINCSTARMATNMADYMKKYNERGGKLTWMAGISSERDITMALDTGCKLGYVHGNMSDRAITAEDGTDQIGNLLEAIQKAGMVGGICCHSLDVPIGCDKAGIKPSFYVKTINPVNYYMNGGNLPQSRGEGSAELVDQAVKETSDFFASIDVPWVGFKVLGAGRATPSDAFEFCLKLGCDALMVGMYDFQVADNANRAKALFQAKDGLDRSRQWYES